jgi:hypothetical protein
LHHSLTASESRAQTLACQFCLSPWLAQDVAQLCYGEVGND